MRNDPREGLVFGAWSSHEQGYVLGDSEVDLISRKPVMTLPRGTVKRWRVCKIEFIVRNLGSWGGYISGEGTEHSIATASPQHRRRRPGSGSIRSHWRSCELLCRSENWTWLAHDCAAKGLRIGAKVTNIRRQGSSHVNTTVEFYLSVKPYKILISGFPRLWLLCS